MHRARMSPTCGVGLLTSLFLVVGLVTTAQADDVAESLTIVEAVPGEPLPPGSPLPLALGTVVTVRFPGQVDDVRVSTEVPGASAIVSVAGGKDLVAIEALPGAAPDDEAMIEITGEGFPPYSLPVRIVASTAAVPVQWAVMLASDVEAARRRRAGAGAGALAIAGGTVREIDLYDNYVRVPIPNREIPNEPGVYARVRHWCKSESEEDPFRILRYFAVNLTDEVYELASVQLLNEWGTKDHVAGERVQVGAVSRSLESGSVVLKPGDTVEGWVWVSDTERLGKYATLVINEPQGKRPQFDRQIPVFDFTPPPRPPTPEELEQQRREREARRVSLHVTGSYGAIAFPAGVSGLDGTETTSLKGAGLRFTKGLFPMLAFEAEIGGATSGVATFADVTVDGMTGDLTRSARLARASFGAMVRFGEETVIPHVRAGIGLQVVDQEATLMTGGGPVDMAGSGVEFGGSVYGGVGVDVKLGSNLIAGVGLAFTAAQKNKQLLDLGISLAYRWDATE